ncbi:MAG: S-adenosylmethionine:tRNA ribosyltransferase-isomerase [Bacteroidia bacterium]|nr:S-adenosylmethionine:tRNA ribosyltransferase-isomerase [Bacteroidia bacterium]MDW8015198.1 S-adenosylmethionine:tRNA ribosyltransferase-isomerase [Bacteroidia bacterium]
MLWSYELPPDRIAQYPLPIRHEARLLVYQKGEITETIFLHLAEVLPESTRLFYNDTQVIPARFRKGSREFLLTEIVEGSWMSGSPQVWKGLYRPARFWRRKGRLEWEGKEARLTLEWLHQADERQGLVQAMWSPSERAALEVIEAFGSLPLPPYLRREVEAQDRERYQTIYAQHPGSVAAPTAGLHFTQEVWERLKAKGIRTYPVTLHVGVGTFLPLQTPDQPEKHPMHAEKFSISEASLEALRSGEGPVVCVGTTTLRLIESLYWLGLSCAAGIMMTELPPLCWQQMLPTLPPHEALSALPPSLQGSTALYILPGYPFQLTDGLITNFHLPGSTLLALVQAFIGRADIERVYTYALENGFRFLSYGDTSLLWR